MLTIKPAMQATTVGANVDIHGSARTEPTRSTGSPVSCLAIRHTLQQNDVMEMQALSAEQQTALEEGLDVIHRLTDAITAEWLDMLSLAEQDRIVSFSDSVKNSVGQQGEAPSLAGDERLLPVILELRERLDPDATHGERVLVASEVLAAALPSGSISDNGTDAFMRTAIITAIATLIRTGVEQGINAQDPGDTAKRIITSAAILMGSGLNLAGAVRDEYNGRATASSRIGRVSIAVFQLTTMGVLLYQAYSDPGMAKKAAVQMAKVASYTLTRDTAQLFWPLADNAPLNIRGLAASTVSYATLQFVMNFVVSKIQSSFGSSIIPAMSGMEIAGFIATLGLTAVLNGVAEGTDDIARARLMHYFSEPPVAAVADALYIRTAWRPGPGAQQVEDQFLTTNAGRTSLFSGITASILLLPNASAGLSDDHKILLEGALIATEFLLCYPAFVGMHHRGPAAPEPAEEPAEERSIATTTGSASEIAPFLRNRNFV